MANEKSFPPLSVDCQLSSIPDLENVPAKLETRNLITLFRAHFAEPWNVSVKPRLKSLYKKQKHFFHHKLTNRKSAGSVRFEKESMNGVGPIFQEFKPGDYVRVLSREEIKRTLDPFDELKGCAFMDPMYEYCDTVQRVFLKVERFLDERSFKVKSAKGLYFLENLQCTGTKVFGRCDRLCYYFWRVEWLEKVDFFNPVGK